MNYLCSCVCVCFAQSNKLPCYIQSFVSDAVFRAITRFVNEFSGDSFSHLQPVPLEGCNEKLWFVVASWLRAIRLGCWVLRWSLMAASRWQRGSSLLLLSFNVAIIIIVNVVTWMLIIAVAWGMGIRRWRRTDAGTAVVGCYRVAWTRSAWLLEIINQRVIKMTTTATTQVKTAE